MKTTPRFKALVPMKHHSERLPGKNFKLFCGRPLYHYIVQNLLASSHVEGVYIDTDSPVIIDDVEKNFPKRVHILERPKELCGDFAPFLDILRYDLSQIDGDYFLQTHSTSPLIQTTTIDRAIERFLESGEHDSLFGVVKMQVRFYDEKGRPINHDPSDRLLRTQSLAPLFEENSGLYLFTRASFMRKNSRIGQKPVLFEMSKLESIDIDTPDDFVLAEKLYSCLLNKK